MSLDFGHAVSPEAGVTANCRICARLSCVASCGAGALARVGTVPKGTLFSFRFPRHCRAGLSSVAPSGLRSSFGTTRGLRPGLYSYAALRLSVVPPGLPSRFYAYPALPCWAKLDRRSAAALLTAPKGAYIRMHLLGTSKDVPRYEPAPKGGLQSRPVSPLYGSGPKLPQVFAAASTSDQTFHGIERLLRHCQYAPTDLPRDSRSRFSP